MEYCLSSLLTKENFIPTSKIVASVVGLLEAAVFGELCSEFDYWRAKDGIVDNGYFFSTVENIENKLFIKRKQQEKVIKNLINSGLISVKKKGCPAKRYIKINQEKLANLIGQNVPSSTDEMYELERTKCTTNKTIYNKTILNKTISSNKEKELLEKKSDDSDFFELSVEEKTKRVEEYCKENNYSLTDANHFVQYYEKNNWCRKDGVKVTSWKLAVCNWERNAKKYPQKNFSSSPISSAKPVNDCIHYEQVSSGFEIFDEYGIDPIEYQEKIDEWRTKHWKETGEYIDRSDVPEDICLKVLRKEL